MNEDPKHHWRALSANNDASLTAAKDVAAPVIMTGPTQHDLDALEARVVDLHHFALNLSQNTPDGAAVDEALKKLEAAYDQRSQWLDERLKAWEQTVQSLKLSILSQANRMDLVNKALETKVAKDDPLLERVTSHLVDLDAILTKHSGAIVELQAAPRETLTQSIKETVVQKVPARWPTYLILALAVLIAVLQFLQIK